MRSSTPAWCAWVIRRNKGMMPGAFLRLEEVVRDTAPDGDGARYALHATRVPVGSWIYEAQNSLTFTALSTAGPPVDVCVCFSTIRPEVGVGTLASALVTGPNGSCCFTTGPVYLWLSDWRQYLGIAELLDERGVLVFESGPLVELAPAARHLVVYAPADA